MPAFRRVALSKCSTPRCRRLWYGQRTRDAPSESHARHFESRDIRKRSLDSAEAPLQQQLSDHAAKHVDHAAKHVDRNDFLDALGTKLLDEVNMFFVEGDVELQFTTSVLDSHSHIGSTPPVERVKSTVWKVTSQDAHFLPRINT